MRTIDEVREWILGCEGSAEMDAMFTRREILEFIDSEPPCKHPRRFCGPCHINDTDYCYINKFCPDCGVEFEKEG